MAARIKSSFEDLKNIQKDIERQRIKGNANEEDVKNFFCQIIAKMDSGLKDVLEEIKGIKDAKIRSLRSKRIHQCIESISHKIDEIILTGAPRIPIEMNYFVRWALDDIGFEKEIKFLLVPGRSLSTANLSLGLSYDLVFFYEAKQYILEKFPFFWIIYVPPPLLRNPRNWPLLFHEVGHTIEHQIFKVIPKYYAPSALPSLSLRPPPEPVLKFNYSKEFQADQIAVSYFGPVFADVVFETHYTKEITISTTHPSWNERLGAITDQLKGMGFKREFKVEPEEKPLIDREQIENLPKILSDTSNYLKKFTYTNNNAMIKKARERLSKLTVFTEDLRALYNTMIEAEEKAVEEYEKQGLESEKIRGIFGSLLEDSIRLGYMKKIQKFATH